MNKFYITTPLYYVNDKPHLGTAYCTIMVDILSRYHRLFGDDVCFLTGTDEHGQKVQDAAKKRGLPPQDHCNEMSENFKSAWRDLNIQYDIFFRTTDNFHKKAVQEALQKIYDQGDIYENTYEGWYCVSEEIYYTEKELVNGKTPTGKDVILIKEKNYFFKMSKYVGALVAHIEKNPDFIQPESRKNEVLGFLKKEVHDLCISRPKSRLEWGVEIPFDTNYVTYVWFDALLNYATGVGFLRTDRQPEFKKWWLEAGAHHVIGKDILTTHAVYWTTMLLALNIPLPKKIFATGWILNKQNEKMSKSQGDIINPLDFKDIVGVDGLRYFLAREVHFGNDAPISQELVFNRLNSELANNLGNLINRTTNLYVKFYESKVTKTFHEDEASQELIASISNVAKKVQMDILNFKPSYALNHIIEMLNLANRYLEEKAPWKEAKTHLESAAKSLYLAIESIRVAAILLQPVMPTKCQEIFERIGCQSWNFQEASIFGVIDTGTVVIKGDPIFPRYQTPE